MDNLENYLYLIFAVIYIISRIIKARAKQKEAADPDHSQQAQPQTARQNTPPKKAFSFEDILKEFEKNLGGDEYEEEKPAPVIERRQEALKPKPVPKVERKPSVYESYEGLTYESQMSTSPEISEDSLFARNEKFAISENPANDYLEMLRSPQGIRNAIVISEIINRKY